MADINTNLADLTNNADRIAVATSAIASAITTKGGTVSIGDGLEEFAADIASIPSGGGISQPRKDVNFYDYDGTIVNSYTAAEFANLSAFPSNPSHDGLTAQGWNWDTLANAKAYVASCGKLDIGQMYITSDGKTRLYISLPEGRTSPVLNLYLNANSELDIDWGDGSTHSTFTSTSAGYKSERHDYSAPGDYVIAITVVTGGFKLQSSTTSVCSILWNGNDNRQSPDAAYNNAIKKIEMGNGVVSIGNSAFNNCSLLSLITIPNGVTSISGSAFGNCSSLSSITIPSSVTTSIGDYAFFGCYSLSSITISNSVTSISGYAFSSCSSLSSITIPNSVTFIGDYAFERCSSLSSVTIPSSVTSIGYNAFNYCYSLSSIIIPNGVTFIDEYAFQNCSSLSLVTISNSVTSIGQNAFNNCSSLSSITIPDSVASISVTAFGNCSSLSSVTILDGVTSIGDYSFYMCSSLSSITIPSSVTSIGSGAFYNCSYMSYIKFESTVPPTVQDLNAWYGVSTSTKILVPTGTLETYKSAANYPYPSKYTYEEY